MTTRIRKGETYLVYATNEGETDRPCRIFEISFEQSSQQCQPTFGERMRRTLFSPGTAELTSETAKKILNKSGSKGIFK